jgi:hypothetical protein
VPLQTCAVWGPRGAEKTKEGMRMLEEEFTARGLQIAPNKTRGPCRCIEFLGLLLCNLEELRGHVEEQQYGVPQRQHSFGTQRANHKQQQQR